MTQDRFMEELIRDVEELMRVVAKEEILSRFGQLHKHDIRAKARPTDLVTIADLEAEVRMIEGLAKLLPGSVFVGEEESFRDASVLDRLHGEQPVWTIDPLDGTNNFAQGKACFTTICALIQNGETLMGWILDPVADVCATVKRGEGVFLNGRAISFDPPQSVSDMTGSLGDKTRPKIQARMDKGEADLPRHLIRHHCCGREYLDVLVGKLHFIHYGGALYPWDHAAGQLMMDEIGAYARHRRKKTAYQPANGAKGGELFIAPTEASFDVLEQTLF
ncbi:inositol monophosphatase family protein [Magnetovibrio sp. PR-2]|uniref:inositol monophosphatase family protein n=1 Tax=Magnetovibrio sp. PR-2 TaxID=3120356 RepID=UPI002FCE689B